MRKFHGRLVRIWYRFPEKKKKKISMLRSLRCLANEHTVRRVDKWGRRLDHLDSKELTKEETQKNRVAASAS